MGLIDDESTDQIEGIAPDPNKGPARAEEALRKLTQSPYR